MLKRAAQFFGTLFLIVAAFFFYWTEQIPDRSHLVHGSHKIEIDSGSGAVDVIGERRDDVAVTVDGRNASERGVNVDVQREGP